MLAELLIAINLMVSLRLVREEIGLFRVHYSTMIVYNFTDIVIIISII